MGDKIIRALDGKTFLVIPPELHSPQMQAAMSVELAADESDGRCTCDGSPDAYCVLSEDGTEFDVWILHDRTCPLSFEPGVPFAFLIDDVEGTQENR